MPLYLLNVGLNLEWGEKRRPTVENKKRSSNLLSDIKLAQMEINVWKLRN